METITAILVIFGAYLHTADSVAENVLGSVMQNMKYIGRTISDITHNIIPCIFGVKSVSMILFTRDNPNGKNIGVDDVCYGFDQSATIIFQVHGFNSLANYTNYYELAKAFIEKDFIVFSLDWSDAACMTYGLWTSLTILKYSVFPKMVQNAREVGQLLASYVITLTEKCDIPLNNIIFVGHSLGAHVVGFAAKEIQKFGCGTVPLVFGADPARIPFLLSECEDRLCKTDANITVVLHTSPFGIIYPIGDINFYFNGGGYVRQPGCFSIICSHKIILHYLTKILKDNCGYPGVFMSYAEIMTSKPPYPQNDTTDCFFMDSTIFDRHRLDKLKGSSYYMFVDSNTICTQDNFTCQY